MHPSLVAIALSVLFAPAGIGAEPVWHHDYGAARQQGRKEQKPLFVVVGSGKRGWNDLSREGELGKEAKQLLAKHYVCLYVDTEHISGRRLASDFEMEEGPGVIISDGTGRLQAFRHEGDLPDAVIKRYVRRFADPDRAVTTTETHGDKHVSNYPAESSSAPADPPARPVSFYPSTGGMTGGCPT